MAALFYDGPSRSFDRKTDEYIQNLLYMGIEYIASDLTEDLEKGLIVPVASQSGQGLLSGDEEKAGLERLNEAF